MTLILFAFAWLSYTKFVGAEYSPTIKQRAKKMLQFANITKKDVVYDLGSGFGGLAIMASRNAKKVTGIEFDPLRYFISVISAFIKNSHNIKFIRANFFSRNINDANVVLLFFEKNFSINIRFSLLIPPNALVCDSSSNGAPISP